jgi:hypothetical protein
LLIHLADGTRKQEDKQMSINTKAASVPQLRQFPADEQVSEGTRFAQYTMLDEIPALVFALMTLVYIVSSLWSLA